MMTLFTSIFVLFILELVTPLAHAYIGPGAGFAVAGSGMIFIASFLLMLTTVFLGPIIWLSRWLKGRAAAKRALTSKVVVVGLDGLDPTLTEQFMSEGLLPELQKLKTNGDYRKLGTTLPALSPVAWSTFQTGVNPGAHNIFDFITRDKRTCLPMLSSTKTESTKKGAQIKLLRGSKPFWTFLSKCGIQSNIVRVPVSYPPEEFSGTILSGMCTPDLRGSQGTFMYFSSKDENAIEFNDGTGGEFHKFTVVTDRNNKTKKAFQGWIEGPLLSNPDQGRAKVFFTISANSSGNALLTLQENKAVLLLDKLSEWIPITFTIDKKAVHGIVRLCLRQIDWEKPSCAVYISPVNVDPEKPALPISHPRMFSTWLAKQQGSFGTLGLLEDTWARNEQALDDALFLQQSMDCHAEREKMFFSTLARTRKGLCVGVFDVTDRVQHMFWRYIDPKHPSPTEEKAKYQDTIKNLYIQMDALVGRVRQKLSPKDVLIVMSDHGFASFRRGVNINRWLLEKGYLALKDGADGSRDYLRDIDWSKTQAYAIGLAGIFFNIKGRERNGIVEESKIPELKNALISGLEQLEDSLDGSKAVVKVYDTSVEYSGIYTKEAPDLIIGYANGYRVSWESVTGKLEPTIFTDNIKAWSGDHHVDPTLVPGIFFMNRTISAKSISIADVAPTILHLFGAQIPPHMEGTVMV